eukprot:CAMPEP_0116830362 /NCGR_PEP_ID=MMETSP0418-20121206/4721_1 /TAXON_ID=1158023 /ORGANISM="Astrosyne radiata, Strain 13vi08-1A" /LENGTH=138 /DNA_ID=CAMNT_0004459457 /DNA_START=135 /DNA_END=548 /DNA_ORIENTATION=+
MTMEAPRKSPRGEEDPVETLYQARKRLRQHEDPLSEARQVAALARTRPVRSPQGLQQQGRLYEKKASAIQLTFTPEKEQQQDLEQPVQLTAVPPKMSSPQSSPGFSISTQRSGGRRLWTQEEKLAVKAGVKLFGIGKW